MGKASCIWKGIFLAIILFFAQFSSAATAGNWQFFSTVESGGGSYSPNTFVAVNPQTGQQTQIGPKGGTPFQENLDWDPVSGFLFGTNVDNSPGIITKINPATGQWTEAANIRQGSTPVRVNAISFSPGGTLYGISDSKTLGVINLATSTFTSIADLDIPGDASGMDFSPQGVLYLVDSTGTGDTFQQWLRTINASTGAITSNISIGQYNVGDIDFAPDGYIYHTNYSWYLFKINPVTGEQTDFGFGGLGPFGGIASVPEPATLLLLGFGAVMLRRKRT